MILLMVKIKSFTNSRVITKKEIHKALRSKVAVEQAKMEGPKNGDHRPQRMTAQRASPRQERKWYLQ